MNPKKPNNSNDDSLQPYNPTNGEYLEDTSIDVYNYYARKLGGDKNKFPIGFPTNKHPVEYIHDYFNDEINWYDVEFNDKKINFLLDASNPKQRYLIFRNLLGYNEQNWGSLKKQIIDNAPKYKTFIDKGCDEWGFRVKIYMPIKFANSNKQLIIKTCWLVAKAEKPKFITAWYENNFERKLRDEI